MVQFHRVLRFDSFEYIYSSETLVGSTGLTRTCQRSLQNRPKTRVMNQRSSSSPLEQLLISGNNQRLQLQVLLCAATVGFK